MSQEIYLPPDLADALRRYFQVYPLVQRLLPSLLCYKNPLAIYRALKYLGIEPWGVAPHTGVEGMYGEVYFAFDECQFTLRVPSWLLPEEVLEEPGIEVYGEEEEEEEGEGEPGFTYIPLETDTCIEFYLRDEGYVYEYGPQTYFLHGVTLTLTEDGRDSVILYIDPGKLLFAFIFTGDRLVFHKVMPLYEGMPIAGAEEKVSAVVELFKSYIDCCKDELIQAVNCATELFGKLVNPLTIYILY